MVRDLRVGNRTAIYARYSTDQQSDRSVEDQIALCRDYASARGLVVVAEYSDRAKTSASMVGREGILDLLADAKAGRFDVVIVEALDRVSRDQEDLAGVFKRLTHNRISLEAVHDGVADAVQVGLRSLMGSIFLTDLKHKTRRGMAGVVRDGRSAGGRAFGYRPIAGRPGELEIVEEEAAVVRRIFEDFVGGSVPRDIAARLNQEGAPAPRGTNWNASTINGNAERGNGILLNALYDGRLIWNRVTMVRDPDTGRRISRINPEAEWQHAEAEHLRIVPADLFAAAQARKKDRKAASSQGAMMRRPKRLLSGLTRCGCCGGPLVIHDKSAGRDRLRCSSNTESGRCSNGRRYHLDRIERAVIEGMQAQLENPVLIEEYLKVYREERRAQIGDATRNRTKAERRLADAKGQIDRLIDLYARGVTSIESVEEKIGELRRQQADAERDLALAAAQVPVVELHPGAIAAYRRNIDTLAARLKAAGSLANVATEAALVDAFRATISRIVVRDTADGGYSVDVVGPISALTGERAPDVGVRVVAGEGLEPPTRGL
ncbi:recombinase family protein [Bosea sp. OAE506]|uniref:recombinase family protein n=1 Tax=Bosea sp. OAE506 TaxID=2663870 RepID=UPI00178960A4